MKNKKILLIDGNSLAYRAFFALPKSLSTSSGQVTGAVYGFTSMLFKVLDEEKPDACVVAFDVPRGELERTQAFAEYKAHRPEVPDELLSQMELIEELLKRLRIPVVRAPGHEADDVLGTLAKKASTLGYDVFILTGDRDMLQIVGRGIKVILISKGITQTRVFDEKRVVEEFGVPPEKLPEVTGLKGDSSDNIPGVPGIGEKGARDLIGKYGSLESLYEHIDEIGGESRKNILLEHRDKAFFSRDLATLKTNLSLDFDFEEAKLGNWEEKEVLDFLQSCEFEVLSNRFVQNFSHHNIEKGENKKKITYSAVSFQDKEGLGDFLKEARDKGAVGVASLIHGLGYCDIRLVSLAIATESKFLVASPDYDEAFEVVRAILEDKKIEKWLCEGKETILSLGKLGVSLKRATFDIGLASYLENPSSVAYGPESLAVRNSLDIEVEGVLLEETPSLFEEDSSREFIYLGMDAGRVFHLKRLLEDRISRLGMGRLLAEVEIPLMFVLAEMEKNGVAIDLEVIEALAAETRSRMAELEKRIFELAGHPFNLDSPKQLSKVLYEEMGIAPIKKTKTGYSTDSGVLEALARDYEIARVLLEYREYSKLKSTYYDVFPKLVCPSTGRLHCSFNQTAAVTGRISSSNPNLQTIPVRSDTGRKMRSAFIPGMSGWKILVADYSQIELRVLAHMSEDEGLVSAFKSDADIHAETASELFGISLAEVGPSERRIAKTVNFGIVY
ncbi:MAG: DNA polymerase I, partial [Actinomycetota bacterium]|nr:DNA polymerase I [Actinomycetota bacterium]